MPVEVSAVDVGDRAARRVRLAGSPPKLSKAERVASGKAARAAVPLESHAVLSPTELRAGSG